MDDLLELRDAVSDAGRILVSEPMRNHTSFGVGGPADYFITVESTEELSSVVRVCNKISVPFFLIGNGSNLLVSDDGVRGAVIRLGGEFKEVQRLANDKGTGEFVAGGGASLRSLALLVASEGFTGFEFAAGIPGSIGGAVAMNAGAYGGEIKDVLTHAELMTGDGTIRMYTNEEMALSYRHSLLSEQEGIVTRAWFAFDSCTDESTIMARIEELARQRREKQPLEYKSAGSTFKRPPNNFAGKLIMEAGLAGRCVGGAEVSTKHCGFIINKGNATADDIYRLITLCIDIVREHSGVELSPEVKLVGRFTV